MPGDDVDLADRVVQALACRQPAICLDSEGDGHRQAGLRRRARDPDRLVGVGHGDRRHHVGAGLGEGSDLQAVIGFGVQGGHDLPGIVAIAARADAAAYHHGRGRRFMAGAQVVHQLHRLPVHRRDVVGRVAELGAPVGAGPPGRALQDETHAVGLGDGDVAFVVARERGPAVGIAEQVEGREVGQVEAVLEDQRGLDTAVGQEEGAAALR